jgi:hypothetical protein
VLLSLSAIWERAVIRTHLADEVGSTAVLPEEYASMLRSIPVFSTHQLARQGGRRGRQIANAQAELAFRKWHLIREGHDPATDPLVAAWRDDIAALRTTS